MKLLMSPASINDVIRLLRAWRFWLLGALIGGLAGAAFYFVAPPDYRARATVVVTFNMEKAWPNKPDNELFYYLERESRKVEEVAWSDATLGQVSSQTGVPVTDLRAGKLELSQPQDGGWHFYASDKSQKTANELAAAWAQAFTTQVQLGVQDAVALDAARAALAVSPADVKIQTQIKDLEAKSFAITPELQISLSQGKDLPTTRKVSLGLYCLMGAAVYMFLAALAFLFIGERKSA